MNSPLSQILLWGNKGRCKLCELTIHFAALSLALPPSLRYQLWHDIRRSSYRTPHLRLLYLRRDLPFLGQQKSSHREENRSFGLTSHKRRNSSQVLERRRFDTTEAERGSRRVQIGAVGDDYSVHLSYSVPNSSKFLLERLIVFLERWKPSRVSCLKISGG